MEDIDQIRLQIAARLKLQVFGLHENPNEERWGEILGVLRNKEKKVTDDLAELRQLRQHYLIEINEAVMSAQHWLDYTYGVERIPVKVLIRQSQGLRRIKRDPDLKTGMLKKTFQRELSR